MSHETLTNTNEDAFIPIEQDPQTPRPTAKTLCEHAIVCFVDYALMINVIISFLTLSLLIHISVEVKTSLGEATDTLHDVKVLVPEMRRALRILVNICSTDVYKPYCG